MGQQDEIIIKIISEGEEHVIQTYRNEYRSLMTLIQDKLYPFGFGDCGGMGRCATCMVRLGISQQVDNMDRNELSTLSKHGITDPSIRLSCQILIKTSLDGVIVTVLDMNG